MNREATTETPRIAGRLTGRHLQGRCDHGAVLTATCDDCRLAPQPAPDAGGVERLHDALQTAQQQVVVATEARALREQEVTRLRAELEAAQAERETDVIQANRLWRIWLWNEFEIDVRLSDDEARAEMLQRVRDANADYGYLRYTVLPERVAEARANAIREAATHVRVMGQQWYAEAKARGSAFSDKGRVAEQIAAALQSLLDQKEGDR